MDDVGGQRWKFTTIGHRHLSGLFQVGSIVVHLYLPLRRPRLAPSLVGPVPFAPLAPLAAFSTLLHTLAIHSTVQLCIPFTAIS